MRRIILLVLGRILVVVGSVITIRLMTTMISSEQIGRLNLLLGGIGLFGLVCVNPVGMYLTRQINSLNLSSRVLEGSTVYLMYCVIIGLIAALSLLIFDHWRGLGINMSAGWLFILAFGGLSITSGQTLIVGLMNVLHRSTVFISLSALTVWGGLGAAAAASLLFGRRTELWYSGQLAVQALVLFIVFFYIKDQFPGVLKPRLTKSGFSRAFGFSWPFVIAATLYWAQIQGHRFLLERVGSVKDVGIFAVCFGLGSTLVNTVESVILQIWQPSFYKRISSEKPCDRIKAWNQYFDAVIPGMLIVCMFGVCLCFQILSIVTAESYHQYGWLLALGVVAEFFRTVTSAWGMIAHSEKKTKSLLPVGFIGTIPLLFFPFISRYLGPLFGMAIALVLVQFTGMLVMITMMSKLAEVKITWNNIFIASMGSAPMLLVPLFAAYILPILGVSLGFAYLIIFEYLYVRNFMKNDKFVEMTQ